MADAIVRMGRPRVIEVVGSKRALTLLKARLIIPIVRIVEGVERPARTWIRRFTHTTGMKKAVVGTNERRPSLTCPYGGRSADALCGGIGVDCTRSNCRLPPARQLRID